MPNIRMPDGAVVRFPDDMPADKIKGLIASKYPDIAKPQQPEAPRQYRAQDVPATAINNLIPDLANTIGNVVNRGKEVGVTGLAKDIAKTGIGMVQEMIPGQQQYETQYADPLYAGLSKSYGFDQPTGRAQWEQIKRQVAEHPVQTGLDASMVAAPLEALPAVGRGLGTVSRAVNPISAAARATTTIAKRAITPFPARVANTTAARTLEAEGVPITAGQATGNQFLKFEESALGGSKTTDVIDRQGAAFTRAGARRIGENTDHLDEATMDAAYNRIGGTIGNVAQRNVLRGDARLDQDALRAVRQYASRTAPHTRIPLVENTLNTILSIRRGPMRGRMAGDAYQTMRSDLGDAARAATGETQHALYGLQRALDDAMERSMSGADRVALRQARRQYRNWLVLERAMGPGSGVAGAAGILTPQRLEAGIGQIAGRRGYVLGRHDFGQLSRAGKVAFDRPPQSGTIPRLMARAVPAALGAAATGFGAGLVPILGGLAATSAGGSLLMSRLAQRYLRNQALPLRELTRAGRVLGATGRVGTGIAARTSQNPKGKP